jgi:uncharacterized damage-inducible protein DinB
MNAQEATALLNFFLPTLENERTITKKVVAAVPEGKTDYRPADKCMTARELAFHLCSADVFFLEGVISAKFDAPEANTAPPETVAEILSWYETNFNDRIAKLKTLSGEQLAKPVQFFGMLEAPAVTFLQFMVLHTAHHRGQLSAYLRPMGAKVPSIYGGSADEPFEMAASA